MNEDDAMTIILTVLLALAAYQIWVQRARLREARADEAELRNALEEANGSYSWARDAFNMLESSHMKMMNEKDREIRGLKDELDKARTAASPKFDKG